MTTIEDPTLQTLPGFEGYLEPPPTPVEPEPVADRPDLEAAAAAFADANPDLLAWLTTQARRYHQAGRRIGIGALIEAARWEHDKTTIRRGGYRDGGDPSGPVDPFRINNNHRAYLARRIMADAPDLDGFFATRATRCGTDEEVAR